MLVWSFRVFRSQGTQASRPRALRFRVSVVCLKPKSTNGLFEFLWFLWRPRAQPFRVSLVSLKPESTGFSSFSGFSGANWLKYSNSIVFLSFSGFCEAQEHSLFEFLWFLWSPRTRPFRVSLFFSMPSGSSTTNSGVCGGSSGARAQNSSVCGD